MKHRDSHIIQHHNIEIYFNNPDDAFGIQNRIAEVFYDKLQPAMEILFDDMFGEKYYATIDKLEIDIGLISQNNWEQELLDNTLKQLKTEISVIDKKKISPAENLSELAFQSFIFFLENGFFPWNNCFDSTKEFEEMIAFNSKLISKLKDLIRKSDQAAARLSYQFSERFRFGIIDAFTADRKRTLR